MNLTELETYLHHINVFEEKQRDGGVSYNDIHEFSHYSLEDLIDTHSQLLRFPKAPFFSGDNQIYISRHNRFAPMQEHLHDFIEINYVYEGHCQQVINGQAITLKQGDFCVLDKNVPHSIEALGEEDILINILINDESFSSLFLFKFNHETSLESKILADTFKKDAQHNHYVIFESQDYPSCHSLVQLLLTEYWSYNKYGCDFLIQYLQLLLMELVRIYSIHTTDTSSRSALDLSRVLDYIEQHYQALRLDEVAQHFGYNSNYLSNLLKKKTGKTFKDILLEKRLLIASDLLKNTSLPMEDVALSAGFNSASYFFRQFKKHYHCTPNEYRKQ